MAFTLYFLLSLLPASYFSIILTRSFFVMSYFSNDTSKTSYVFYFFDSLSL